MKSGLCVMLTVCGLMWASGAWAQQITKQEDAKKNLQNTREIEMLQPTRDGATPIELRMNHTTPLTFEARVKSWPATPSFQVRWRLDVVCSPSDVKRLYHPSVESVARGGKPEQGVVFGATALRDDAHQQVTFEQTRQRLSLRMDGSAFPLCGNKLTPYQLRVYYEVKGVRDSAWTARMWTVNHPGGLQ